MKKEQSRPVHYFIAIIAVAAGVLFDQWTKLLVLTHLKGCLLYTSPSPRD